MSSMAFPPGVGDDGASRSAMDLAKALEQTSSVGEPLMLLRPNYAVAAAPACDPFDDPVGAMDFAALAKLVSGGGGHQGQPGPSTHIGSTRDGPSHFSTLRQGGRRSSVTAVNSKPSSAYGHIPKPSAAGIAGARASAHRSQHHHDPATASQPAPTPTRVTRVLNGICGPLAALRQAAVSGEAHESARQRRSGSAAAQDATCSTVFSTPSHLAAMVPVLATQLFFVLGGRLEHSELCNVVHDGLLLLTYVADSIAALSLEVTPSRVIASAVTSPVAPNDWRHLPGFACMLHAPTSVLAELLGSLDCARWIKCLQIGEGDEPVASSRMWVSFAALIRRFVPRESDMEALLRSMAVVILALECRIIKTAAPTGDSRRRADATDDDDDDGAVFPEPASERDAEGLYHLAQLLGAEWAGDGDVCDEHSLLRVVKLAPCGRTKATAATLREGRSGGRKLYRVAFVPDEVSQFIASWVMDSLGHSLTERRIGHAQHPHHIVATRVMQSIGGFGAASSSAASSPPRTTRPQPVGGGLHALTTLPGDSLSSRHLLTNCAADIVRTWAADALGMPDEKERADPVTAFFLHQTAPVTATVDANGPSAAEASKASVMASVLLSGAGAASESFERHVKRWGKSLAGALPDPVPIAIEAATGEVTVRHGFGCLRYFADPATRPSPSRPAEAKTSHAKPNGRRNQTQQRTSVTAADDVVFDEERRLASKALAVVPALRRCFDTAMRAPHVWFVHVVPTTATGFMSLKDAHDALCASLGPSVVDADSRPRVAESLPHTTFCGEYFQFVEDPDTLQRIQEATDGGLTDSQFVELVCGAMDLPRGSYFVGLHTIDFTAEGVRELRKVAAARTARDQAEAAQRVEEMRRQQAEESERQIERAYEMRREERVSKAATVRQARASIPDTAISPSQIRRAEKAQDRRTVAEAAAAQRRAAEERRRAASPSKEKLPPWLRDPSTAPVRMNRAALARLDRARTPTRTINRDPLDAAPRPTPATPKTPSSRRPAPKVEVPKHMQRAAEMRSASAASSAADYRSRSASARHNNGDNGAAHVDDFEVDDWRHLVADTLAAAPPSVLHV